MRPIVPLTRRKLLWLLAAAAIVAGGLGAGFAARGSSDAFPEATTVAEQPAHQHDEDEASNIVVADLGAGTVEALTHNHDGALATAPAWSPDGTRIAFAESPCHGCATWIATIDVGGAALRRVVRGFDPSWSPDGRRIVYVGPFGGLFIVRRDGSGRRRVPTGRGSVDQPSWSPTGEIAFIRQNEAGAWRVYRVAPDGSGLGRLTAGRASEANPVWSPDGRRLAFARQVRLRWRLFVVDSAGGRGRPVVVETASDTSPAWSPDGRRLVYVRQRRDRVELAVVRLGGGRPSPVLVSAGRFAQPAWSGDGRLALVATSVAE